MRQRIREDVTTELERLIEEHGDIFYRYEISDDFRQVRIYEASDIIDRNKRHELGPEMNQRISSLIGLYHAVKEGRNVSFGQQRVRFIEPSVGEEEEQ